MTNSALSIFISMSISRFFNVCWIIASWTSNVSIPACFRAIGSFRFVAYFIVSNRIYTLLLYYSTVTCSSLLAFFSTPGLFGCLPFSSSWVYSLNWTPFAVKTFGFREGTVGSWKFWCVGFFFFFSLWAKKFTQVQSTRRVMFYMVFPI